MRIQSAAKTMWDDVDSFVDAEYTYNTGFVENYQAALGNFIDENQSISEVIHTAPIRERNEQLREMMTSGQLSPEETDQFRSRRGRSMRYDEMAEYVAAQYPDAGIRTTADLEAEMKEDLKTRRDYFNQVRSQAGFTGDLGAFTGMAQGVVLDPVIAAGFVVGPTAAVNGANFMRSIGYSAARFGGYAAGEEAVIQAQVAQWKDRIDSPYTIADVVGNIAGAGIAGGLVGAGAAAINKFLAGAELPIEQQKPFQDWLKTPEGEAAARPLGLTARELEMAPDPNMTVEEFSQGMAKTEADLNTLQRPDGDQVLEDIRALPENEPYLQQIDDTLDQSLPEETVDLKVPSYAPDGSIRTTSLRQELETLQEDTTQMVQLRECLTGG